MKELYDEMNALETMEARIYKCMDKLEAVIQHNESALRPGPAMSISSMSAMLRKTFSFPNI